MPDRLDGIREELSARLGELRPVVDEHSRLEAAMQALGDVKAAPAREAKSSPAEATKSRARKTPATERRKRAPRGANREAVLRAVSERPGATKAELAAVSGVEPKTLSVLIGRLIKAGELQTRALPTGRAGYALADTPPAQPASAQDSADTGDDAAAAAPPDAT